MALGCDPKAWITGSASVTNEQERSVGTMDEQEKRETAKAAKQYTDTVEASKQAGAEQQANEAAEQFADAVKASYQAVAKRGEEAQQRNAEQTQKFLGSVIHNLRGQVEGNRAMTQELADQQRRGQEAGQSLMQESVSVYMDFVNSMFSSYQGSGTAEVSIREDEGSTRETGGSPGETKEELRSIVRESVRRSEGG